MDINSIVRTITNYEEIKKKVSEISNYCRPYYKNSNGLYVQEEMYDDLIDDDNFGFCLSEDKTFIELYSLNYESAFEDLFMKFPVELITLDKSGWEIQKQQMLSNVIIKEQKQDLIEAYKIETAEKTKSKELKDFEKVMVDAISVINETFSDTFLNELKKEFFEQTEFKYDSVENEVYLYSPNRDIKVSLFRYNESKSKYMSILHQSAHFLEITPKLNNKIKKNLITCGFYKEHITMTEYVY